MYLSSKPSRLVWLGASCAAVFAIAPAAAEPAIAAAHPGFGAAMTRTIASHVAPRFGARLAGGFPRRYGFGNSYYGAAGAALATAALSAPGYEGLPTGDPLPPGAVAPPEPPPIPPQPACPMIIKVGPGLDHPVQTRVIYGRPECY